MLFMIVKIKVAQAQAPSFERAFGEFANKVRIEEPGTLLYELARDRDQICHYTIIEGYRDDDAQQAHAATEHMKSFLPFFSRVLAEPPQFHLTEGLDSAFDRSLP